eukprot:TRINITY_DN14214_c0_g2_i1.p1 TRINITY_DN14214_c0_g2~~TRINITY_DN14214_c0_g2_i1.p1  ORF type:complete len:460 (-),score=102.75 TRINITY_DN14214_c0_g2_i1:438-1817(-)
MAPSRIAKKVATALALLAAGASGAPVTVSEPPPPAAAATSKILEAFEDFQRRFHKHYRPEEVHRRFAAFRENYLFIEEHNGKDKTFDVGLTPFADLTREEFKRDYTLSGGNGTAARPLLAGRLDDLGVLEFKNLAVPPSVDWARAGAVSDVKNQGKCGACWAFATTGALEGAWKIATDQLISLSEQQLLDCTGSMGSCNGGNIIYGIQHAQKQSMCTEFSYGYNSENPAQGQCRESSCSVALPFGAVRGGKQVVSENENALMEAVAQQPVGVAVDGSGPAFQLYHGGVLKGACGSDVNHAVLLVGYGTDNGVDYFKIKNSWGPGWGEGGYARIARGVAGVGECAILTESIFPVVDGSHSLWKYSVPWGLIFLGTFALIAFIAGTVCFIRKRRYNRSGPSTSSSGLSSAPAARAPFLEAGRGQRLGTTGTSAAPVVQVAASGASAADRSKGNSRASRLLQ